MHKGFLFTNLVTQEAIAIIANTESQAYNKFRKHCQSFDFDKLRKEYKVISIYIY